MRVIIPGGTGQVGSVLVRHFACAGDDITVIGRTESRICPTVIWNARDLGGWCDCLDGADVVINLTGKNVNCRYTPANRAAIKQSRVESTLLLGRAIAQCPNPPRLW